MEAQRCLQIPGRFTVDLEHHDLDAHDEFLIHEITRMSPEQIEALSEVEKKALISNMITKITASFDQTSKKHQIDVEFSATVSRLLVPSSVDQQPTAVEQELPGNTSAALCVSGVEGTEGDAVKRFGGSTINLATDHAYSVTVE